MFVLLGRTSRKNRVVNRSFRKLTGDRVFPRSCGFLPYQPSRSRKIYPLSADATHHALFLSLSQDARVIGITHLGERYNRMPHLDDVSYRPMFRAISERQTKYGIRVDLARLFFSGEDLLKWRRENDAVNFTKLPRKITFAESDIRDSAPMMECQMSARSRYKNAVVFPRHLPPSSPIKLPLMYAR